MELKDNIRRYRRLHEMTQDDLADAMGVSRASVSQWESGYSVPRMQRLDKLAEIFGVRVGDLLGETSFDEEYGRVLGKVPSSRIYDIIDDYGLSPDEVREVVDAPLDQIEHWIRTDQWDAEPLLIIRAYAGKPIPKGPDLLRLFRIPTTSGMRATVPLVTLGSVHAGPFSDEGETERTVEVPASVLEHHPNSHALIVEGDCMDRFVLPGMAVVYDPDLEPRNGSVAIVETEDYAAVMRRWYMGGDTLLLAADSHERHEDIVLKVEDGPVKALGVVVWVQSAEEMS